MHFFTQFLFNLIWIFFPVNKFIKKSLFTMLFRLIIAIKSRIMIQFYQWIYLPFCMRIDVPVWRVPAIGRWLTIVDILFNKPFSFIKLISTLECSECGSRTLNLLYPAFIIEQIFQFYVIKYILFITLFTISFLIRCYLTYSLIKFLSAIEISKKNSVTIGIYNYERNISLY